jgi:hypothetical protein
LEFSWVTQLFQIMGFQLTNHLQVVCETDQQVVDSQLDPGMQSLVVKAVVQLNFQEGQFTMLYIDSLPDSQPPLVLAQLEQPKPQPERVLGLCYATPNAKGHDDFQGLSPDIWANRYFKRFENEIANTTGIIAVLTNPKHGTLVSIKNGVNYSYHPKEGYFGEDHASFLVEFEGKKVRVEYFFNVIDFITLGSEATDAFCNGKLMWKISALPTNETNFANLLNDAIDAFTGFGDLAGTTVGETTGLGLSAKITLESNAAGHGW